MSEFLLQSKADGRQYWVTPLTPDNSDSQKVIGYSMTLADEANTGQLNQQRVFVLNNDDPLAVNLDDLEARVRNEMTVQVPGFFPGGGVLIEFLPVDNNTWQVYGEVSGRVAYRIEVQIDQRVKPQIVALNDDGSENGQINGSSDTPSPTQPTTSGQSHCAADLSQLSDNDLKQCLVEVAEEVGRR